jgi:arginase
MSPSFVVVPQWQGSASARAMRLIDGADAIRGDLPPSHTHVIDVPAEAGDGQGTGVHRFSSLTTTRQRLAAELAATPADWALTVGGDCGVSLAAVENAASRHPDDLALVWFDAHPDLNTAESSPSGVFGGMVLRAILGDGCEGLALGAGTVPASNVVLVGARDVDPGEEEFIAAHALPSLDVDALATPDALVEAVRATGARHVYLHIDLDVLDPADLAGLANPVPFGIRVPDLTGAITALKQRFELAGATIAGFSPATPDAADDDLPAILRIIGALTR